MMNLGQSAAPQASRPNKHELQQSLGHKQNLAAICAVLVPLFRIFACLVADAEPTCDPSLYELIT
jgi:hypothetical protein